MQKKKKKSNNEPFFLFFSFFFKFSLLFPVFRLLFGCAWLRVISRAATSPASCMFLSAFYTPTLLGAFGLRLNDWWFHRRCECVPFTRPQCITLNPILCAHVRVCVRVCVWVWWVAFQPHGGKSIVQWTLAPLKISCMYDWVHVHVRVCVCVRETWADSMLVWLVFQSHLKLWMTWSPLAISRLQPQSPLLPNDTRHNVIHLPFFPSALFSFSFFWLHASFQQPLAHKYAHTSLPPFYSLPPASPRFPVVAPPPTPRSLIQSLLRTRIHVYKVSLLRTRVAGVVGAMISWFWHNHGSSGSDSGESTFTF